MAVVAIPVVAVGAAATAAASGLYYWIKSKKPEKIKADIIEVTKGKSVRIIFVGPNGAGKSSLINTFMSAMKNKRVKVAVSMSQSKAVTTRFSGYFIEENEKLIITLLDTSGFDVTRDNDEVLLENIKAAFEGRFPYHEKMTDKEAASDGKIMEPINIVLFVYNAQTIIGTQQNPESCLPSLIKHVRDMNLSNMLLLTHADCIGKKTKEEVIKKAKEKLEFDASDIHLLKCLVDLKFTEETSIPSSDRTQALKVLYAVTNDAVEKKNVMESRERNRQELGGIFEDN